MTYSDYKDVPLPKDANVSACVQACCMDPECKAFSFNQPDSSGKSPGCEVIDV